MTDLLLGLVGGLLVAVTAWVTRLLSKAAALHEVHVEEGEESLAGKTPEEGLAALINEKIK